MPCYPLYYVQITVSDVVFQYTVKKSFLYLQNQTAVAAAGHRPQLVGGENLPDYEHYDW